MNNREFQRRMAYEALVLLLLLALLLFITRLWPILLLVILGIFAGALRLLFLSSQKVRSVQPPASASSSAAVDPELDSFSRLQAAITERVQEDCPGAKWVWENRNPRRSIRLGEPVAILLNRASGYRRADLRLSDGELAELIYQSVPSASRNTKPTQPETVFGEPMPENYDLIAFEWVDKHLLELNEKLNEAIGLGLAAHRLSPGDLPQPESWDAVCRELQRNGLRDVKADMDGILIKIRQ